MKPLVLALILGGLLVAALAVAVLMWFAVGDTEISFHGFLAMGLGALLSLVLGVGLMALVFFSSRRGYDDRANR